MARDPLPNDTIANSRLLRMSQRNINRTCADNLFTRLSSPSLAIFAGKFTAGANGVPFSSETN